MTLSLPRPICRGIPLGSAAVRSRQQRSSSCPRALPQAELSLQTLAQLRLSASKMSEQSASMMSDPRQQGKEAGQVAPMTPSPPLPPVVNWFVTPKCNYGCKVRPAAERVLQECEAA